MCAERRSRAATKIQDSSIILHHLYSAQQQTRASDVLLQSLIVAQRTVPSIIYHCRCFHYSITTTMKSSSSNPASDSQRRPKPSTAKPSSSGNGSASIKDSDNATPRRQRSHGNKLRNNPNNNNNEKPNPKRRRRYNSKHQPGPRPPHPHNNMNAPEARVIQDPSSHALISDSDHDDDNMIDHTCCKCYNKETADHNDESERLLQESIERHTRIFSFRTNPEFFVVVRRSGNEVVGDDFDVGE